jgi:hypothetical protein
MLLILKCISVIIDNIIYPAFTHNTKFLSQKHVNVGDCHTKIPAK